MFIHRSHISESYNFCTTFNQSFLYRTIFLPLGWVLILSGITKYFILDTLHKGWIHLVIKHLWFSFILANFKMNLFIYWFLFPVPVANYPTQPLSKSSDSLIKSTPLLSYGVKSLMNTVSPATITVTKTNKNIQNVSHYWISRAFFIGNVFEFLTCAWHANIWYLRLTVPKNLN